MDFLRTFAETADTAATDDSIFAALGIDWRLLILQIIAFLILVVALGKFVYPWLMKSVDERQAGIEAAAAAATKAEAAASESQAETAKLLTEARKEAANIVATAKLEASEMVNASELKAKSSAEKIVADAQDRIGKDVEAARKALRSETIQLVALATEKVVAGTHTAKADEALIAKVLEGSK